MSHIPFMTTKTAKKRDRKESAIIDAAERVMSRVGYSNAKMENIAEEAGISKGTVYFYFDTKENLYLAIAHRGLIQLNDDLYNIVDRNRDKSGLESVLDIMRTFLNYSEVHILHTEAMLDYMAINRSSGAGRNIAKLTEGQRESIYFRRLQDIHNIPLRLVVKEIKRGQMDGSIRSEKPPEMLYLIAWANCIGFMKLNVAAGRNHGTLHGMPISEWKAEHIEVARYLLAN